MGIDRQNPRYLDCRMMQESMRQAEYARFQRGLATAAAVHTMMAPAPVAAPQMSAMRNCTTHRIGDVWRTTCF
jgi:hypothetical protein